MLDFEKELEKFAPTYEGNDAAAASNEEKLTDMAELFGEIMKELKARE